jgi:light-regulated signal transduction histidine kinase (bacteriophytochrome)
VAAVPIFVDGRHDSALVVYSGEPGRFDDEELQLLERLAGDVGFAIEAAGKEGARRKAERQLETLNKNLERRVRERTDALEAANAELEAFSYSVSHDLRAPLRALDGFSLALLEDYGEGLDDEAADYLQRIRAASQRMARLIDDLLMLSRVTRREMRSQQVDLSAIAGAIVSDLFADDASRQVRFMIAENMVVDGDPDLLDVALRNQLGNAWKFTTGTADAEVAVGVEESDGERRFFVRDNGAGFEQQYADKLFAPFQRLHGDNEFPGTGIGLATVQRIVRRHGGRVWAEGATGKGATVWFTIGSGVAG